MPKRADQILEEGCQLRMWLMAPYSQVLLEAIQLSKMHSKILFLSTEISLKVRKKIQLTLRPCQCSKKHSKSVFKIKIKSFRKILVIF